MNAMSETPKQVRNHISYAEQREIDKYLQGYIKDRDDGTVEYLSGWNDAVVAECMTKHLGREVTPANVAGVRKEVYGTLYAKKVKPAGPTADFDRRLTVMQTAMNVIATKADEHLHEIRKELTGKTDAIATLQRKVQGLYTLCDSQAESIRELFIEISKLKLALKHK